MMSQNNPTKPEPFVSLPPCFHCQRDPVLCDSDPCEASLKDRAARGCFDPWRVLIDGRVRYTDVALVHLDWRKGDGDRANANTGDWAWVWVLNTRGTGWINLQFRPELGDRYLHCNEHAC
jgi:hypothetical protein